MAFCFTLECHCLQPSIESGALTLMSTKSALSAALAGTNSAETSHPSTLKEWTPREAGPPSLQTMQELSRQLNVRCVVTIPDHQWTVSETGGTIQSAVLMEVQSVAISSEGHEVITVLSQAVVNPPPAKADDHPPRIWLRDLQEGIDGESRMAPWRLASVVGEDHAWREELIACYNEYISMLRRQRHNES